MTGFIMAKRLYRLYTLSPYSVHVTPYQTGWWREDADAHWELVVRAHSTKQARYLASRRVKAEGRGGLGIVETRAPTEEPAFW